MMRQSASRNQRAKGGFRLKLVLQICLLLAICTWLLYQVKHSHDKKKAFEDKISKISTKVTSKQSDLFDFGRKGLPLVKENDSISHAHAKDADNEEDEVELDQDMKQEEDKHEEAKYGIDELDQDRGDEENQQEEEFFSEEEKDGQAEEEGLFDDNKEGQDIAQEAREENYKRDDASSAVAHDSLMEVEEDSKANDLEISVNGTVDDAISINNGTLGYRTPISNVSFAENVTLTNADLSINGSHSTEVSNQSLPEKISSDKDSLAIQNGSKSNDFLSNTQISQPGNYGLIPVQDQNNKSDAGLKDSLAIQNGSKFNDSVSNTQISQPGSYDLIPVQDQNNKSNAGEGHELEDHRPGSTTKKNEDGYTTRSDLLTVPVIEKEVKDSDDKAAE